RTLRMLDLLEDCGFELAAAALLHAVENDPIDTVAQRLRLSNRERDHIGWLIGRQHALDDAPALPQARLKRLLAAPLIGELLNLVRVRRETEGADLEPVRFCEESLRSTPPEEINPPPLLTGNDLIRAGFKPGPHFKPRLETIRDAQLNGEIGTKEEALELAGRHEMHE
ncbi:MAG: CCA tRNA nucleotidyltransferase, partial [Planctomycetaceae bacterium]